MLKRRLFLFHAFLISGLSGLLSAQSTPDEPEILGPATGKGGATVAATTLQARAFALPGMVGSVVAIAVADDGTVYLTQTYRRNNGEPDIRKNPSWLEASLASRSVEDKRAIITSRMKDWKKMAAFEEKIIRLRDLDGDGKADERVVHFSGLNNEVDGLAAGLAWSGGSLFLTCTPGFYRLEDADHAGDRVEAHPLAYGFGIHIGYGGHDMHGALQGPDGRLYWSQGDRGAMVTDQPFQIGALHGADGRLVAKLVFGDGEVSPAQEQGDFDMIAQGEFSAPLGRDQPRVAQGGHVRFPA